MARGYKLDMPELGERKLFDLRIGIWRSNEGFPVATEVEERVNLVAVGAARRWRADKRNRRDQPLQPTIRTRSINICLQATMASRMPDESYSTLVEHVKTLDADDNSERRSRISRSGFVISRLGSGK